MDLSRNSICPVQNFLCRVFLFCIFCFPISIAAQSFYYDDGSAEIKKAYELAEFLMLDDARDYCQQLKTDFPGNLMVYHVENYIDFYTCFITEEDQFYQELSPNKEIRLKEIRKGDPSSPYYRFCQAEILLQWALVELKFKKYVGALLNINKATGLLEENKSLFPDFALNNKSLSVIHALIGTIPDAYKKPLSWISSFDGTIKQGYQEINEISCSVSPQDLFYKEIFVIKAMIETHLLNEKTRAWETVSENLLDLKSSPLIKFITSNIAHRTYDNNKAIAILEERKPSDSQLPFFYLDYLEGAFRLTNLDPTCEELLLNYVERFRGKNYIKESLLNLAWYEYAVLDNEDGFYHYLERILEEGEAITDEDKYALSYAKKKQLPNRAFLRARLLFDGRNYEKAKKELLHIQDSLKLDEKEEFYYRLARIHFEQKDYAKAIDGFNSLIHMEIPEKEYSLASLYYTALAYENLQNHEQAILFYKKTLNVNSGTYKSSLHQKAKAGILRLK